MCKIIIKHDKKRGLKINSTKRQTPTAMINFVTVVVLLACALNCRVILSFKVYLLFS